MKVESKNNQTMMKIDETKNTKKTDQDPFCLPKKTMNTRDELLKYAEQQLKTNGTCSNRLVSCLENSGRILTYVRF